MRQDKKPYVPKTRGRETSFSRFLTVLPFTQGLVILYQLKTGGSPQQPLLEAKQFLVKAFFFLRMCFKINKKLATDKFKEEKKLYHKESEISISQKLSKYESD